jgi:hypothetical protein
VAFHPSRIRFDLLEVVDSGQGAREYMAACTQLFLDNLLLECGANCSVVPDTDVHIRLVTRTEDLTLNWNTDEKYTLDISSSSRGTYRAVFPCPIERAPELLLMRKVTRPIRSAATPSQQLK